MRVLVVAASPPWPMTDGASLVLNHQLRYLAPRHEVTVLAAGRRPGERTPSPADVGLDPDLAVEWFAPTGNKVVRYAGQRARSVRSGEPAQVFAVESGPLVAAFDRAAPLADVVHLHGWGTARLAARTDRPCVHTVLDAWQTGFGEQRALPAWRRALEADQRAAVRRHERRHYARCHAVVVVADHDADTLRRGAPGARVVTIPNGVVTDRPAPGPAADPVLGFHGVLSTVANETAACTLVDEVLPRVRRTHPDARALLVGRDAGPGLLRRGGPAVEIRGPVPDVLDELARMVVYVAPMTRGRGIKNKVLEAMAAGLPVVATPRAVDGIGATEGIVVADGPDALAAASADLLADPAERRRRGAAGRARAERSSWAANADALEALWTEAVVPR